MNIRRSAWFVLGMVALGLGALGVVLPLLPTTPFVLVAAYAFARSSDRWHAWLLQHKVFGPLIRDWQAHGAIGRPAKIAGLISILAVFGLSVFLGASQAILIIQGVVLSCAAFFIVSRPTPPDQM